jgi:hypothetical protein
MMLSKQISTPIRIIVTHIIVLPIIYHRYLSDSGLDDSDYLFAMVLLLGILCIRSTQAVTRAPI